MESEARTLIADEIERISGKSLDEIRRYLDTPEERRVRGESGREYRLTVGGWEDPDDEETVVAEVKLHGVGLRRLFRLKGQVVQPYHEPPGPDERPDTGTAVTTRTQDLLTGLLAFAVVVVLIGPWFVGVGFLISRLF